MAAGVTQSVGLTQLDRRPMASRTTIHTAQTRTKETGAAERGGAAETSAAETGAAETDATGLRVKVTDLRMLSEVRGLVEAEFANVIPYDCADGVILLVDELTARAAAAGLLPVQVSVRRDDAGVDVEARWHRGPGYLAAVFEQWSPDLVTDWGARLIKETAEVCGVTLDADRSGRLWARLSTL